jgi:Uma2 family endonuclease
MSTVPKRLLSPQEYLALERQAEFRSEFFQGEMFAMAGAKYPHNRVKENMARNTGVQLGVGPCFVLSSDMRVKIEATGLYTYPDVIVICDDPQFEDEVRDTLLNPRALVEVLSDSTEKYDRGTKSRHYRQIPSLQEYVLVAQEEPLVERYVRQPDDSWLLTEFAGLDKTFVFASVPVRIPLAEIYRGVELPENPGR